MHYKNLHIGTQLRLGLGLILFMTGLLCLSVWVQTDRLWMHTSELYMHPFTVRRALGEIKADIHAMHTGMEVLHRQLSPQDTQSVLQQIDAAEAHAMRQFTIVFERYLGPRQDVSTVYASFIGWRTIRAEGIRAMTSSTRNPWFRGTINDADQQRVQLLLEQIARLSDFAEAKAKSALAAAGEEKDTMGQQLLASIVLVLLACGGIMYHLLGNLRAPLLALTRTAEHFRQGRLEERVPVDSRNEFGLLGMAFNDLADSVSTELTARDNVVHLAGIMLQHNELSAFCRAVLTELLEHTGAQCGAVYLLDETGDTFRHFDAIGMSGPQAAFSAAGLEGEFGLAIQTGQIQRIVDIPAETRHALTTTAGTLLPREILTIPISAESGVIAIISLASLRPFQPLAIRLIHEINAVLASRMNALLLLRIQRTLANRLEAQNQELESQKQMLTTQADELMEQNIELEMQKNQMDEANRLKSAFLSNMSHELRTPLNSVIALSELLGRRLRASIPDDERTYLEMIERNGKQLLELINTLLDLARIEAGREELDVTQFPVTDLTLAVATTLEPQAQAKNIELRHSAMSDLPLLRSDFGKCRHILQNLVANAVKFTENGYVEISAALCPDGVEIRVSDTGVGILANQLEYIFDEFRQGDESMTRNYGGTGLGLSIARKYATLLQGRITVTSAPGEGSTFVLFLPLTIEGSPAPKAPAPDNAALPAVPNEGRGKNILLVEDSEPAVIQMTDILNNAGYTVTVARDGTEALERVRGEIPDAMILDLMMPGVDGFEVLKNVRGMSRTSRLPVLILTAKHVTREELSFLTGNGIHQLIQKGDINKTDLLNAISSMVHPPAMPESTPLPRARKASAGPLRILVAEDNPDNMTTMRALLQDDAVVLEAETGSMAVAMARTEHPHIVLMDIALPDMDGFEALNTLRRDAATASIPVIAVTASAMKGSREVILARGFDGYVSKPVDVRELQRTIRSLLDPADANPAGRTHEDSGY